MNKIKLAFLLILLSFALNLFSQSKKAYQLYDGKGVPLEYPEMIKQLINADFVFFGELHNNAIAHWLELEVTKDLYENKKQDLVLAAEMFESDNQLILDEYLSGLISNNRFEAECRLWPNYKNDYKPLIDFAKDNSLTFVASNVPRRYASLVSQKGFEGLDSVSTEGKGYFPPLPIVYDPEVPCYKSMMEMMGMGGAGGHGNDNLPKAQALKDAAMAFFSLKEFQTGKTILHYNGSYHSQNHEGIVWYINTYQPGLNIKVIHTVTQKDIHLLDEENKGTADFVLVVDEDVTTTY